ncbi:MAG: hypothetical protein HYS05_13780 [Acidobacteria bacterium]|nr:hypothetical protein [Acidobacteriota bacterium]
MRRIRFRPVLIIIAAVTVVAAVAFGVRSRVGNVPWTAIANRARDAARTTIPPAPGMNMPAPDGASAPPVGASPARADVLIDPRRQQLIGGRRPAPTC